MDVRPIISGAALALLFAGTPSIVSAQDACIAYMPLRLAMEGNGVQLEGSGYISNGEAGPTAIEIWVSQEGRWSIIAVYDGIACILLSGAGWIKPEGV